ncbi:hypothetical protein GCM10023238_21970 [Streptomyces heliomycini]
MRRAPHSSSGSGPAATGPGGEGGRGGGCGRLSGIAFQGLGLRTGGQGHAGKITQSESSLGRGPAPRREEPNSRTGVVRPGKEGGETDLGERRRTV